MSRTNPNSGLTRLLPPWVISLCVHLCGFVILASFGWSAASNQPDRVFPVGIVIRSQRPNAVVYRQHDQTLKPTQQVSFVPDPNDVGRTHQTRLAFDTPVIGRGALELLLPSESTEAAAPQGSAQVDTVHYFDVQASGTSFVFVIDRSGSMHFRDLLGAARAELIATLGQLRATSRFQIIMYNSDVALLPTPRQQLVAATEENKAEAGRFLDTMVAEGGTDHFQALEAALALNPEAIVFLTDGDSLTQDGAAQINSLNRLQCRIHVVEFGSVPSSPNSPLRRLTDASGGQYQFIDLVRFRKQD